MGREVNVKKCLLSKLDVLKLLLNMEKVCISSALKTTQHVCWL